MTTWLDKIKNKLTTPNLKNGTYTLSSDNNVVLFEDGIEVGRGTKITFNHNGGELAVVPLGTVTQMQLENGDTVSDWKPAWEDLPNSQKPARLIEGSGTYTYTGSDNLDNYTAIVDVFVPNGGTLNGSPLVNGINKIEGSGVVKIELSGDGLIFTNPQIKDYYAHSYGAKSVTTGTIFNPITKIRMYYDDESAVEYGTDDGSTLEIDSKWATPQTVEYVHSVINGYEYIPVDSKGVYADPATELGDIIIVDNQEALVANTRWTFDGSVTVDIETPLNNEDNYDEPYNKLVEQQFKRKVSLGDSYQGVTIDRQNGLEMLLSPDGGEENAIGKFYADLKRGMAFQYRDTPSETWKDWLYFDVNEKVFKIQMYEDMIENIELNETFFAYSPHADGVPMYEEPAEDRIYIGFASAKERPTEPSAYKWSKAQGKDGQSIESVSSEFYLSTSKEEQKDGSWTSVMPTWQPGNYLWTRLRIDYINPVSTEHTTPEIDASWEALEEVEYRLEEVEIKVEPGNIVSTVTGSNDYNNTISSINQRIDNIQLAVDSKNYFNTLVNGAGEEGDFSDWEFETTGNDVWRRNVFNETMLSSMTGVSSVSEIVDYDIPNFHQPNGTKYYEVHGPGDVLFQTNNFNRNYKYILTGNFMQPFNGIFQIVESNGIEFLFNPQSSAAFNDELEILPSDIYLFLRFRGADYKEPHTAIFIRKGTLSIDEYEQSGVESVIFEILDDETSLASKKLSFYANGKATNGKFRIVKGRQYSYSVKRTKGTQPFTIDFNEYNANQQFIKKQTVTFKSGGTVEQTTLNNFDEDTLYISLTYNITGVSGVNRLELTEAMMNIGEPQEWNSNRDSTEVFKWARSEFEIQALQIQQKVSVGDYTGNVISSLINQTATTIKLQAQKIEFEGLVTANSNFKVLLDGSVEMKNALVKGEVIADRGKVGNLDINNGVLKREYIEQLKVYSQSDITRLQAILREEITPTANDFKNYDINRDGILSALDVVAIMQIIDNGPNPPTRKYSIELGTDNASVVTKTTVGGREFSSQVEILGAQVSARVLNVFTIYPSNSRNTAINMYDESIHISTNKNKTNFSLGTTANVGGVNYNDSVWLQAAGMMHLGSQYDIELYANRNLELIGGTSAILKSHTSNVVLESANNRYTYNRGLGFRPQNNNTQYLGASNGRWSNVYLANNPNVSSDKRIKNAIQDIPQDLVSRLIEIKPKMYLQGTEWHFGYIAQDVERALYLWATKRYGKEAKYYVDKFAMLHKSESHLSLLYGELAVLKEQQMMNEITKLNQRLETLENETRKHRTSRSNKRTVAKKRNARIRKRSLAS